MKSLLFSAAIIMAIARLCRDRDQEPLGVRAESLPIYFPQQRVENLNKDPRRPYDLFNFYYPPGQTSVRFH
jgi:hypothetical protein